MLMEKRWDLLWPSEELLPTEVLNSDTSPGTSPGPPTPPLYNPSNVSFVNPELYLPIYFWKGLVLVLWAFNSKFCSYHSSAFQPCVSYIPYIITCFFHSSKSQSRSPSRSTLETVMTQQRVTVCHPSQSDFFLSHSSGQCHTWVPLFMDQYSTFYCTTIIKLWRQLKEKTWQNKGECHNVNSHSQVSPSFSALPQMGCGNCVSWPKVIVHLIPSEGYIWIINDRLSPDRMRKSKCKMKGNATTCRSAQCFNLFRRKASDRLGNWADNSSARTKGRNPGFSLARNSRYMYTNNLFPIYVWRPFVPGEITSIWGSWKKTKVNITITLKHLND